ncbi:hypothetical protein SM12BL3_19800 [Serratia marcescens]|nr:hypothetical protein SM12BL3_19800 [Serratia marcescens]
MSRWLANHRAPDFFVGCNNQISLGPIKACIEHRLPLMQDVALFSIDEVSHAEIYGFHFSCVPHDLQELAWQALNLAICRTAILPYCRPRDQAGQGGGVGNLVA